MMTPLRSCHTAACVMAEEKPLSIREVGDCHTLLGVL